MNETRLANYRRKLLKGLSTTGIYIGIVVLICLYLQKGLTATIDYTVTMTIGCIGTLILSDILYKLYFNKDALNTQYTIVFFLSIFSLISFTMAFFSTSWTVFVFSLVVFALVTALTFFLAHYSYLPSLRTQSEVVQEELDRKALIYGKMTNEEIVEDMLKNIKYFFKSPNWSASIDLTKPMFLDSNGTPQSAKSAAISNSSDAPINEATDYFEKVVATKESYNNISEVR